MIKKNKNKNKTPNQTKEEMESLPEKEFRIMIVKMIQNLQNKLELQISRLETRIEKMQEMFNKDLNGILTCILSCKNRIASLCLMQDTACLGVVHGDDPEECCGGGGGRDVHVWDRMYTRGGFMSMYGKTNTVL